MSNLEFEIKKHDKKRKFALVLQGGGMRAVYSAGALVPLIEKGLSQSFDHVIGSSAGAINGTYFLTSYKDIPKTYIDELTNNDFIDYSRLEKIVDIDFLVDKVLARDHPIEIDKLEQNPTKLHIVLTNASSGKCEVITDKEKIHSIYEEFRATAALPILYDEKISIGDKKYIDGGVSDLIPIDIALKLGCTDIVVIMTRRLDYYHFDRAHTRLIKHLVRKFAKNHTRRVKRKLPTDERLLKKNIKRIQHPVKGVNVYALEPSDEEVLISLGTTDKKKVKELAELGYNDMHDFLKKTVS